MGVKVVVRACLLFGLVVVTWGTAPAVAQTESREQESVFAAAVETAEEAASLQQAAAPARTQRRLPPAAYSKTGYIDSAIIGSYARVRLDLAFDNTRPDRGEFIYAKCGCYREVGLDPLAPGPAPALNGADPTTTPFIETGIDFTDFWVTAEYQFSDRVSGFVDGVVRSISSDVNDSATGIGDLIVGFKAALINDPERFVTFQLKTILPTGNAAKGLGTANTWWEPGVLYFQEINDRADIAGEVRISIPIGGSSDAGVPELTGGRLGGGDFSSTVVRYGIGGSYDVNPQARVVVAPVVELVAWSVAGGYATTNDRRHRRDRRRGARQHDDRQPEGRRPPDARRLPGLRVPRLGHGADQHSVVREHLPYRVPLHILLARVSQRPPAAVTEKGAVRPPVLGSGSAASRCHASRCSASRSPGAGPETG